MRPSLRQLQCGGFLAFCRMNRGGNPFGTAFCPGGVGSRTPIPIRWARGTVTQHMDADDPLKGPFWLRLGMTGVCGGLIGLERQLRGKPAGIRTTVRRFALARCCSFVSVVSSWEDARIRRAF